MAFTPMPVIKPVENYDRVQHSVLSGNVELIFHHMHGLIDKQTHIAALMGTLLAMLGDTFDVWNDFAPL